jgi:superfamily II DNA or RNA helicase
MLKDLDLNPVYDSSECNLVRDLISPLLSESKLYWRGVGFFTSGWLKTACQGLVKLVENGGKARIVTSPIMQKADWEALQTGDMAKLDETLRNILDKQVGDLFHALSKNTLNALAWMVSDDILEFRFAIPREYSRGGEYHDKVGVFIDEAEDSVAIHGSFNDSEKGSLNGEAFSVFKSWEKGQRPYVEQHRKRLTSLWKSGNSQFVILSLPEAIRSEIVRCRTAKRPYTFDKDNSEVEPSFNKILLKDIKLRPYQKEAIDAWKRNGYKGILEMATGTGKTFTALAGAVEIFNSLGQIAILILVPYLHLLEQWRQNCERFGFLPILCSGNHDQWPTEVRSKVQDFNICGLPCICIIAVHQTAASGKFANALKSLPANKTMLIADEVHGLGAPKFKNALLRNADMRLGLSATPRRWFDEDGTQALFDYFEGICFEFSLRKAIGTFLTPYRYYPVPVHLTNSESEKYEELSRRIALLVAKNSDPDVSEDEILKKLLIQRARIVSEAENKNFLLTEAIKKQIENCFIAGKELQNTLVYCAPGKHKEVLKSLSKLGLRCHEFVHYVSMKNRENVLKQFAKGDIQVLIAIHCLDEGVDIPSTQTAYFLASTTNPKEFIQRRGRILRKFEKKERADVYDFIVVPDSKFSNLRKEADLGLLKREMPRFAEFAEKSENEFSARAVVREILDSYEMLHLLDIKPWEIYRQVMETFEIVNRSS